MDSLRDFQSFDAAGGSLNVWVFRKSQRAGNPQPTYTGHWVDITKSLEEELRNYIQIARTEITELKQYALLEENNENSALSITTLETHAGLIVDASESESPGRKVKKLKDLDNIDFYTVKIVSAGITFHAVRRTDSSWISKKASGFVQAAFSDEKLDLDKKPRFSISRYFDFFILGDSVLISNKKSFETVLSYKMAHTLEFKQLKDEKEFVELFSDMKAIDDYVGSNKIQLRRAFAIRQKGHYKDPDFVKSLQSECQNARLTINFRADGKIIPCEQTCPHIFQALLDHRLMSLFSKTYYDVPSANSVA